MPVGPVPWNHEAYWKFREQYKRQDRGQAARKGFQWSLESGYRADWDKQPRKPEMREIRDYRGRIQKVPVDDYQDFIGHFASGPSDPDSEVGKYIYNALDSGTRNVESFNGVGHIGYVEYSPTYQVMRVEFVNQESPGRDMVSLVVFFTVPTIVYSELEHLADNNMTQVDAHGKPRHLLGIRFWDIVRIRGQLRGSKYRYEYAAGGPGSSQSGAGDTGVKAAPRAAGIRFDEVARRSLSGSSLNAYRKLPPDEREAYLTKAGIITG